MTRRLSGLVARSGQVEDRRLSLAFLRIEAHHLKNLLGHLSADRQADELLGRLHGYRKVVRPFTARQALQIQRDRQSTATIFDVRVAGARDSQRIDLLKLEGEADG